MSIRRVAQAVTFIGFLMMNALLAQSPVLTTIYTFAGVGDGSFPQAGLVVGSNGVLYGTTYTGGLGGWGTVFELLPAGAGAWTEKTIYSFTGGADGANPLASLMIGSSNILYGTTSQGGAFGFGTVFQLIPAAGGLWTEKTIYTFAGGADGATPMAPLVKNANGVLYGTTSEGGTPGWGTVFQLVPAVGGTWTEKVVYTFTGGADGGAPVAGLLISSSNTLYGTTYGGGASGYGAVFQLVPAGGGLWTENVLYSFTGGADGGGPEAGLAASSSTGVLYGTTYFGGSTGANCLLGGYLTGCGTVFQLAPPAPAGTWTEQTLYTFAGGSDGTHPYQKLAISGNGALFGTTFTGGSPLNTCFPGEFTGCGTMFVLKPPVPPATTWTKSSLYIFQGNDGGGPNGVVIGTSGVLYGTNVIGGTSGGYGTVFQWKP